MASDDEVGTVTDVYGDRIVMSTNGGAVCIQFFLNPGDFIGMWLGPAEQEEFVQLLVAACHQAKVNAAVARAAEEARLPGTAAVRNKVKQLARDLIGIPDGL